MPFVGIVRQEPLRPRQDGETRRLRVFADVMNLENGLLIAAVIGIAVYLLAALTFPERF